MKPIILTLLAGLFCGVTAHGNVTFTWATVGDPGNPADPLNSGSVPGIGSVSTTYNIATTEVNLFQYTEFLNAVDPDGLNSLGLYSSNMATNLNIAGIYFASVAVAGSKYAVIGSGDRPVTYVNWNDAARFTNWLNNGQGSGSTEFGVYDMTLATPTRSASATYWIPSENEWYKAAYYDPGVSGPSDDYWEYPMRSDSMPGNVIGSGANQANFRAITTLYSVTQNPFYDASQNYLTMGGAYTASASYYGTYDQGGNVWEWNDTVIAGSSRGLRGGSWYYGELHLRSLYRNDSAPTDEGSLVGFRVASVPEPSAALLMVIGGGAALLARRRWKATL